MPDCPPLGTNPVPSPSTTKVTEVTSSLRPPRQSLPPSSLRLVEVFFEGTLPKGDRGDGKCRDFLTRRKWVSVVDCAFPSNPTAPYF